MSSSCHRNARRAAEAAICAGYQGAFWEMHASLFRNLTQLEDSGLISQARELGLDEERFTTCLAAGQAAPHVDTNVRIAEELGLHGTPVFLIAKRMDDGRVRAVRLLRGAVPEAKLSSAIEDALNDSGRPAWWIVSVPAVVTTAIVSVALLRRRSSRTRLSGGDV